MIQKYKGLKNEEYMIRANYEETNELVITASEDGFVYIWNKINKENSNKKNYAYEFFKPFARDTSSCSLFANDECTANYLKKLFNLTTKIMVYSLIINTTVSGRIQVLINCDEI
jgi:hypothetical protein